MRWLVALVAGSLGCASQAPSWTEVRSRHFALKSDVGRSQAESLVQDLERSYAALRSCVNPGGADPPGMTEVVALGDEEEFRRIAPPRAGAYFHYPTNLIESKRRIVFPVNVERHTSSLEELLQHELSHRFVAHTMPNVPVWFNEGMAEFLSTARLDGSEIVLGDPPSEHWFSASGWLVNREPLVRLAPDPAELRTVTSGRLDYQGYVGAWMLVHVMVLGEPRHRRALESYLADLRSGRASESEAFSAHFDAQTLSEIDASYVAFQTRSSTPTQAVALDAPPVLDVTVRTVPPAEALATRGWLWRESNEDRMRALADANGAIALDPKSPEGYLLRASVLLDARNRRAAIGDLRTALRLAPDDRRVRRGLGALLLSAEGPTTEAKEQVEWIRSRAASADDFRFLAHWELWMRRPEQAHELAGRGVALDIACIACYEISAEASFRLRDREAAIRSQRQALNVAADDASPKMHERLTRFRKAPFPSQKKKDPRFIAPNSMRAQSKPPSESSSSPEPVTPPASN